MDNPKIFIEKSRIPIVWVDTSIITNMCILKSAPEQLDKIQQERIEKLYDQIYKYGREGKIICPLADQEGEVWVKREEWMDTIRDLSLGIECISLKGIEDNQRYKAMQAYVSRAPSIYFSYKDIFYGDPTEELLDNLKNPYFVTTYYDIFKGADYQRNNKNKLIDELNYQRARNISSGLSFDAELSSEYTGEINILIQMSRDLLNGKVLNENDQLNYFGAHLDLCRQLKIWEDLTVCANDFEGLVKFYISGYNINCPCVKLSCYLLAKIMTDPQPIRTGDPMDIKHISTMMPFSDLFITDKAWSFFLKRKSFDTEYGSSVCYVGDTNIIDGFFNKL